MSGIPERVWKLKLPCHVDNAIMKHMETIIKKIDRNQIDQVIMEEAGSILKNGGLVAFPTETVYGLGANALDEEAAKKTYAAKGRPSDNPLIVHIARLEDLGAIVESVPLIVDEIAAHFWPGPLTMIFNKNEKVPLGTTGGLETVAVRMPDDEIARELIIAGGGYVSAPSANTSGRSESDDSTACGRGFKWQDRNDPGWRKCRYRSRVYDSGYDGDSTDDSETGSDHKRDVK